MRPRLAAASAFLGALLLGTPDGARGVSPHPNLGAARRLAALDLSEPRAAGLDAPAPKRARLPRRLIVLPVDFADRPHPGGTSTAAIDSLFFGPGQSVRRFYATSSFGRLEIEGLVLPWIRLPQSFASYADAANEGLGVRGAYPRNARRMAEDAVRAADAAIDFALFDDDGPDGLLASGDDDGLVDALVLVHTGPAAETGDPQGIVSHTWTTLDAVGTSDGVAAYRYSTVALESPLGTCAHEYGHLLGLPDLYQSGSVYGLGGGLGNWSLMAAGSWLDDGWGPADLDATSKIELGFVDAFVPDENASGLPLVATTPDAPGTVYTIWSHGQPGLEFFVVENRQPRGLDRSLPGGGMLVYHVDRGAADNNDTARPRVALLQADGRTDIERRINNGDAGDPYPGLGGRLDATTTPSTRARDGSDTQVRFTGISAPTPNMRFDLSVESTPALVVARAACHEIAGDGDGAPEAGETVGVEILLRNLGLGTGPLEVRAATRPPSDATWQSDYAAAADVAKHDSLRVDFVLVPRAGLADPWGLTVVALCNAGTWTDSLNVVLGIGERTGIQVCFEPVASQLGPECDPGEGSWTVEQLGTSGSWTLETQSGELGSVYRSASGPRYANASDVALVSPTFRFVPGSVVRLLHSIDAQAAPGGLALDGGLVECSLEGGAWEPLEPRGGWPARLVRESVPALAEAGVFSGTMLRRWDLFDLGTRSGSARLRFRFVAGASVAGAGWEIVRVEVGPESAGSPAARLELVAEPNPGRLPAQIAFRITSPLTWAAQPTTLGLYDARGRLVRALVHAPAPASSGRFVWDGTDASGQPVASGVYFARLEWGSSRAATKLWVVR